VTYLYILIQSICLLLSLCIMCINFVSKFLFSFLTSFLFLILVRKTILHCEHKHHFDSNILHRSSCRLCRCKNCWRPRLNFNLRDICNCFENLSSLHLYKLSFLYPSIQYFHKELDSFMFFELLKRFVRKTMEVEDFHFFVLPSFCHSHLPYFLHYHFPILLFYHLFLHFIM
jgi:hypothetical protein